MRKITITIVLFSLFACGESKRFPNQTVSNEVLDSLNAYHDKCKAHTDSLLNAK